MKKVALLLLLIMMMFLFACANTRNTHHTQNTNHTMTGSSSPVIDGILQKKELVLGTSGGQPPFSMTTKDGQVIGFDIDLAKSMAEAMGARLKVETFAFDQLLPALAAGKVDMVLSGMTMTSGRNLDAAFVGPYFISGKAVLTKIETIAQIEDASEIDTPEMTLTALAGSTSQAFIETVAPQAAFVPAKDYDEAVDMVLKDNVKALVADYPICIISIFRHPGNDLISLIRPLTFEPLGIALPKGDALFINWMENFLDSYEGAGLLDQLKETWFGDASWVERLP